MVPFDSECRPVLESGSGRAELEVLVWAARDPSMDLGAGDWPGDSNLRGVRTGMVRI